MAVLYGEVGRLGSALFEIFLSTCATMWASGPTAGATLATRQIFLQPDEVLGSRLGFLEDGHVTNPFVAGEGSEVVPKRGDSCITTNSATHITW